MKLYKLTNENSETRNQTKWGENVTHTASGEGELCGPGWLHAYTDRLLAVLLNPVHAGFGNPQLWLAEGKIGKREGDIKVGCKRMRTIKQIKLPAVTTEQRVKFAILCALEVYRNEKFVSWANNWLAGSDRSQLAAQSEAQSAEFAAQSAAQSAEFAAESAAQSAARSAARLAARLATQAATWAARSATQSAAQSAAWAARSAAQSAEFAAQSAAWVARSVGWSAELTQLANNKKFSLLKIARKACEP